RRLAAVAGVSVLCTALLWLRTDHLTPAGPYFGLPWDHHMYIYMASHGPLSFHVAPYAWRILGPSLVWAIPFGVQAGFQVVTLASIALTAVLTWVPCRRLGSPPRWRPRGCSCTSAWATPRSGRSSTSGSRTRSRCCSWSGRSCS